MRLITSFFLFLVTACFSLWTYALAPVKQLTIVNHFTKSLTYTVGTNPDVLPDLGEKFVLEPNTEIKTRVLNLDKEAYINVRDLDDNFDFFGVEILDNDVKVHGYLSKGIAFSWTNQIVVFCTPEEYQKKNSCL